MSQFLLDTNAVIALLKTNDSAVRRRIRENSPKDVFISTVVMFELYYGAYRSARVQRNLELLENILLPKLEFDSGDAMAAGQIRAILAEAGTPIGPYDVLIAGQALSRGMCLITRNTREFQRVAGLQVTDWESN
jgi:tRNA(fMet)-specific endonuclease VapC